MAGVRAKDKATEATAASWVGLIAKDIPAPVKNFIENIIAGGLGVAAGGVPGSPGIAEPVRKAIRDAIGKLATDAADLIEKDLETKGHIRPEDANPEFAKAIGDAIEFGFAAHITSAGLEAVYPTHQLGLAQLAGLLAEFSGFKELVAAYHGPLVWNAIRVPSMAKHGKKFRSRPPSEQRAAEWRARGLIADDAADDPIAWSGLMPEFEEAEKLAAFRPARPFALLRGLGIINIDRKPALDAMKFGGMRDQDAHELIAAAERTGLQPLRNAVLTEVAELASEGLLSEADLTSEMQDLNLTQEAQTLTLKRVRYRRLRRLAGDFKRELDIDAKEKVIPLTDYQQSLISIGYQQQEVDVFSGQISAFLEGRTLSEQAREQAAINRDTERLNIQTVREEFQKGNTPVEALPGAFAGLGLTLAQAAAHTALEVARNQPSITKGTKLSKFAQQEKTRREQVRTTIEEYSKGLIKPATAKTKLETLGMADDEIFIELKFAYDKSLKKATLEPPTA